MRQIIFQGFGLSISEFAFGTAGLHRVLEIAGRKLLLSEAIDSGFSHFDTAPYYGFGIAEETLGALSSRQRQQITVATKVGLYPPKGARAATMNVSVRKLTGKIFPKLATPRSDWSVSTANVSLEMSLRRLKRERVDILFLHEPEAMQIDSDAWLRWLEATKVAGKVGAYGVAGERSCLESFLSLNNDMACAIQTRCLAPGIPGTLLAGVNRAVQFTYGHLSSGLRDIESKRIDSILRQALQADRNAVVLVSTTRRSRLRIFEDVAGADR